MQTQRLILREWTDDDLEPFAALNADTRVMEFLPALLTREQSDEMATRIRTYFQERGFGLWAVEVRGGAKFIGFVGLTVPRFEAHFTPCVEVGWRLAAEHWGQGYAPEAARAALDYGFTELALKEIVSITVPRNLKSRRVMEKIGLRHDPTGDFLHPLLSDGHLLQQHVLYRLSANDWKILDPDGKSARSLPAED